MKKIYIAIPCYGGLISELTFHSLINSIQWFQQNNIAVKIKTLGSESLISRARNKMMTMFLDDRQFDGTHLFFIDADIGFDEINLSRLINLDKEIVTGIYPVKDFDWENVKNNINLNKIDKDSIESLSVGFNVNLFDSKTQQIVNGFARVKEAATGFMLIKKEAFLKMMKKFPERKYFPDERSAIENSNNAYDFFSVGNFKEDNGITRYLSEDYFFCRLWEKCSGEIWSDLASPLTHIGKHEFKGRYIDHLKII